MPNSYFKRNTFKVPANMKKRADEPESEYKSRVKEWMMNMNDKQFT